MNKTLALAAGLALAGPSMGGAEVVKRDPPIEGWLRANGKLSSKGKRMTRDPSKLQLRGYAEIPCEPPKGYFWNRSASSRQLYYLVKTPPMRGSREYDETFDRTIIRSGWGYVKLTYAPGDQR